MPTPPRKLQHTIAAAFVKELEAFKRGGYRFGESGKALFPGTQHDAFDAYLEGVRNGHLEGYYEIPTGVGKTALFIAIIGCYLRATENIPDAPRVLIHEPTTDLVIQTAQSFAEFLPDIAKRMEADDDCGREIDWVNSQIDVHYTRRHGADNKPKVLITTYQGQAADQRKPKEQRIHNPADFGLVIHDEAHYLTGAKYGPAAVDTFRGAIQLGVTATPEYSEDKTVANKLGHRYYHLPLINVKDGDKVIKEGAIDRGDLCHVRPILIKTVLTEQEKERLLKQAKGFLVDQGGRPLSESQLEQLYNQVARNKAILNAYLTGSHPDTGERFLGQTGMIFGGGITHCDDFVRYANTTLSKPAYRDVKNWLRNEGLCLIAPIHTKVPKEGVEIILGGKKELCTPDRIKELHRQGKILLLISDKQLMLGTDFPMDSFIADAVDRFSVPDATQRMGRGFRVDRGDERRGLEPNPEKSCAAINVIDETTHEIYKGTPFHPIHAIEILHGAEHRPPGRREGAVVRFKEQPPQVHEELENLGFEFISRTEALRAVARKFEDNKKKQLPEKTDDWLSSEDISKTPGGNRATIKTAVKGIFAAYDEERLGNQQIIHNGQSIRVQKMQSGPQQPVCIYREDWPKVEKAAGVGAGVRLPEKTDEWLSTNDIKKMPGSARMSVKAAVKSIVATYDEDQLGEQRVNYNGQSIRVQKMQSGARQPICIYRDDWPKVEKAVGASAGGTLPEKTEEWLSETDRREMPGGKRLSVRAAVKDIITMYDEERLGEQLVKYNGQSIRVEERQSGSAQPICIHRDDWPKVEQAAGVSAGVKLPQKTDEWLSSKDISAIPGGQRAAVQAAVASIVAAYDEERLGEQLVEYNGQSIRVEKRQSGVTQPICIHRDDWPNVEKAAGVSAGGGLPEKTNEWLSATDISKMFSSRHALVKVVKDIITTYDEERLGEQLVKYNGQSIRVEKRQSWSAQPICIHRDDWPKVEKAAGVGPGGGKGSPKPPHKWEGSFVDRLLSPSDEIDPDYSRKR